MNEEKIKLLQKWMNGNAKGCVPKFIDESLRADKEFIMAAIDNIKFDKFNMLKELSPILRKDKELVINAINHELGYVPSIDSSLLADKDVALALVAKCGNDLQHVSEELKDDKEVVLTAVSTHSNAIAYASSRLKEDRELVLFALSHPILHTSFMEIWAPKQLLTYFVAPKFKDDKEVLLTAVDNGEILDFMDRINPLYRSLPMEYKLDHDIALKALKANRIALKDIPQELFSNKEFVLKAIDNWMKYRTSADLSFLVDRINKSLLDDKDVAMKIVSHEGGMLRLLSSNMKNDKEVVLTAIKNHPGAYGSANLRLKMDEEVLLEAARRELSTVSYTKLIKENKEYYIHLYIDAEKVKSDFKLGAALAVGISNINGVKITMEDMMKNSGIDQMKDVDKKIKVSEEFVVEMLKADHRIRGSKKISPEVIEDKSSKVYEAYFYSQFLLTDKGVNFPKELILYLFDKPNFHAFDFEALDEKYRSDKDIVLEATKRKWDAFRYAAPNLKDDKEYVLSLLKDYPQIYIYISDELKADKDVMLTAINGYPLNYQDAPSKSRGDKDIALAAVSKDGEALEFVPSSLRSKEALYKAAIASNPCAFVYAPMSYRNDKDIVGKALSKKGELYRFISDELKEDRELLLIAVSNYGLALQYAPSKYKKDKDVVVTALKNDPKAIKYVCGELQLDKDIKGVLGK